MTTPVIQAYPILNTTRKRRRFVALLPGLLGAAALLGCQFEATAPAERHVSQSDLDFVTGLSNLAAFDREVIGNELARASDPRVRVLALDLKSRIEAFNQRVQSVAAKDGIVPPRDIQLSPQSDPHSRIATLMATSRYYFDKEFISDELAGNQEILSAAEATLSEPGSDPELRSLLVEARSRLRDNLVRLRAVQGQIEG